jgi:hypothetical protein
VQQLAVATEAYKLIEGVTGFEKGDQVGSHHSPQSALDTGQPTGYDKNIEYTR